MLNLAQNINLVYSTHDDGRSRVKSGCHFRISTMSTYFEYLPFKNFTLGFQFKIYFQNGHAMTPAATQPLSYLLGTPSQWVRYPVQYFITEQKVNGHPVKM